MIRLGVGCRELYEEAAKQLTAILEVYIGLAKVSISGFVLYTVSNSA